MSALERGRAIFQRLSPAAMDQFADRIDGGIPEWVASDVCIGAAYVPERQWFAALWTEHGFDPKVRNALYDALMERAERIAKREGWPKEIRGRIGELVGFAMAETMPTRDGAKLRSQEVRAAAHGIKLGTWRRDWEHRYAAIYQTLVGWSDGCLETIGKRAI